MKKKRENLPVTLGQLSQLLTGQQEYYKHWAKELIEYSIKASENSLKQWFESKLTVVLDQRFSEFHTVMVESIEEIVIKDRAEPLEKRVSRLKQKNSLRLSK